MSSPPPRPCDDCDAPVEWKVTWFPAGRLPKKWTVASEADARRLADDVAESFPVIERRSVSYSPWETVENYGVRGRA